RTGWCPPGHGTDQRIESREPDLSTLTILGEPVSTEKQWLARRQIIDVMQHHTVNQLRQLFDRKRISLGIVRPKKVLDLIATPTEREWSAKHQFLWKQGRLFGEQKPLTKIPYKFQYVFACDDSDDEYEKDSKDESKKDSKKDKLEADDSDDDPDKDKDKKADDDSVVGELAERFGIDTSKTTFEESIDGIVELTKAASEQLADQQLEALWKELPDVQQFAQFRLQGGKAEQFFETFFPQQDYSKLEVKEDNTTLQEQLIRTNLQLLGREDQDVTDTIDEFKTSGILHSQSQRALKDLAKHQVGEKERIIKERNEAALVATASQEDYLKEMKGAIKEAKDFKGFVITENDKDSLYDYVSTEIDNGQSQFQKDMEGAELEVYLAIAMLMRKGFNLDGLVSRRAATKNAQTLRDRLAKKQEKVRADEEKKKSENVTDVNVEDIDFSLG
ncbi:hypothetical protein LCGC14_1916240, partial [marine sediment metagenome]